MLLFPVLGAGRPQRGPPVDPRQGLISWDLDTSLGPRTIYLKDRSDIRPLPDGRIILTDVHGAKYQIPPVDQLDDRSRSWLEIEM